MSEERRQPGPLSPPRELRVPGDLQPDADGRMVWWRPSWGDVLKRIGLGWLYLGAFSALVMAILAVLTLMPGHFGTAVVLGFWAMHLWLVLGGIAVAIVGRAIQVTVKSRHDVFCVHCGYSLEGLPDHYVCPECGRPYSLELSREYGKDPAWFVERWRMQHGKTPEGGVPIAAGKRRRKSKDGT